jgi:hypothetical protein
MIRKLSSGKYRLYSRKRDPRSGKRRIYFMVARPTARFTRLADAPGTLDTRKAAEKHERAAQYFKRH